MGQSTRTISFNPEETGLWFTSDTHFFHGNIIEYCNRPFKDVYEMNEALIQNWNDRVKPGDVIFHLGDFGHCGSQKLKETLERLNGRKYLILGNHDWRTFKAGQSQHFELITQQMFIKVLGRHVYLNHFPFLCMTGTYKGPEQAVWQFFGHIHSGPRNTQAKDNERIQYLWPTQYDVGVDNNEYAPVNWWEIKETIDKRMTE